MAVFDFSEFLKRNVPHGDPVEESFDWASYSAAQIQPDELYGKFVNKITFLIKKEASWTKGVKITLPEESTSRVYTTQEELLSACVNVAEITELNGTDSYIFATYNFDPPILLLSSTTDQVKIEREDDTIYPTIKFTVHSWQVPESEI